MFRKIGYNQEELVRRRRQEVILLECQKQTL
jgi:hypothetical protein